MTASIVAEVQLKTDTVGRSVAGVTGKLRGLASSTSSVFKGVLGATAVTKGLELAGAGVRKFGDLLHDSVGEARESQQVGAVTARIIKATGGAAKISADQIGKLTTSLSNKDGVDDEAIQKGANLLLTFKNVRNEVGKGNKIFNRATAASVDLSKAGFGSIESTSKTLGKALNDPVKGMSALSRAGVTFSDKQKETIKKMVKTGDVLGAQKLIMKEVESQVGGVAAANATAGEKAKVYADNLKEQFGTVLLPLLDKAERFFVSTLGPAISRGIGLIGPAFAKIEGVVGPILTRIQTYVNQLFGAGGAASFASKIEPIKAAISGVVNGVMTVVKSVLPIAMQVFATIVGAVRANLPAILEAYKTISTILKDLAALITTVWSKIGPIVLPILKSVFGTIIQVIGGALKIVSGVIKLVLALIRGDWSGAWNAIKLIVSGVWQIIKAVVGNGVNQVRAVVSQVLPAVKAQISAVWNSIKAKTAAVWAYVSSYIRTKILQAGAYVLSGLNSIKARISSAWSSAKSTTSNAWNSLVSTIKSKISSAVSTARSLPSRIRSVLSGFGSYLRSAGRNLIQGFINGISGSIGAVISRARSIAQAAVSAVKNALGIHSPSTVFAKLGAYAGKGAAIGLDSQRRNVAKAAARLAGVAQDAYSGQGGLFADAASASAAPTIPAATVINLAVTVESPVGTSPVEIGRELTKILKAYASSTGQRLVIA